MSERILVGLFSCWAHRWQQDAIRKAWLLDLAALGMEYRFFLGVGGQGELAQDEVGLDCGDSYQDLTHKLRAMCEYSAQGGYRLFKADLDTYVNPGRLATAIDYHADLQGCFTVRAPRPQRVYSGLDLQGRCDYCCGGAGTLVSPRALEVLACSQEGGYGGASDEWMGHKLGGRGMRFLHDPRFLYRGYHLGPGDVGVHLSQGTGNYDPAWMGMARRDSL